MGKIEELLIIRSGSQIHYYTRTDSNGAFSISLQCPSNITLAAFHPQWGEWHCEIGKQQADPVVFHHPHQPPSTPLGPISGTVQISKAFHKPQREHRSLAGETPALPGSSIAQRVHAVPRAVAQGGDASKEILGRSVGSLTERDHLLKQRFGGGPVLGLELRHRL